jgi:hypothetical protein
MRFSQVLGEVVRTTVGHDLVNKGGKHRAAGRTTLGASEALRKRDLFTGDFTLEGSHARISGNDRNCRASLGIGRHGTYLQNK